MPQETVIVGKLPGSGSGGHTYTGLTTETAQVTVNNTQDTIKVDIPLAEASRLGVIKLGSDFELNESNELQITPIGAEKVVSTIPEKGISVDQIDFTDVIINGDNTSL